MSDRRRQDSDRVQRSEKNDGPHHLHAELFVELVEKVRAKIVGILNVM